MPRSLLNDKFFDSFSTSVLSCEEAESLPPECYVDPEFFAFEKETMFFREWLCVGRASWVKEPGEYFTATHVGEPLVITRTREGEIAAMSAVCQHRGMLVAEGCGRANTLICPYHNWVYSLNGTLVAAPAMETTRDFTLTEHSLPRLKVEVWQGFIFVNFWDEAPPLGPRLAALDDIVANYDLANLDGPRPPEANRFNWNWKVMFENNNDGYHANRLHNDGLHDHIPSSLATFPELPADSAGYYRLNGSLHPDASFNPTLKALFPILPKLTDEERNRVLFVNVPPTLSLVMNTDSLLYLIISAEDADYHSMAIGTLLRPDAMKDTNFKRLINVGNEMVGEIVAQDQHIDALVHKGLKSKFAPRGRYSWQEGAQRQLNLWLVDRYRKGWELYKAAHARDGRLD
ncbi:MAG TPA: aromatic ring-hydroxylating dioxygenase subunit alpha [Rhizomicrobium sp.]|nr:aromatic ring-hydroxylating dioxygenase subunit alpha [Rhizomicrobium sp.]